MATDGVETPTNEGGENESHDSEEEAQRPSVKDGGPRKKILTSLSYLTHFHLS